MMQVYHHVYLFDLVFFEPACVQQHFDIHCKNTSSSLNPACVWLMVCVCVCVRACVRACVCVCVRGNSAALYSLQTVASPARLDHRYSAPPATHSAAPIAQSGSHTAVTSFTHRGYEIVALYLLNHICVT